MGTPTPHRYNRSNLFLVRLWTGKDQGTDSENARVEWCGKVQRVVNGEARHFTNLQELVGFLEEMVSNHHQHNQ